MWTGARQPAAPRMTVLVDRLPLRGPGKPDRVAIRTLARAALPDLADRPGAASPPIDPPIDRLVDLRTGG